MSLGLALIGNPGTGKSTILNGLVGKPVFESGLSLVTGLTKALQKYEGNNLLLYDTPGLGDIQRKKQAGEELDLLLQEGIDIRFCFVVTLESGRARNEDAITIDLVLSAIKNVDVNNKFGVIINKLPKAVLTKLKGFPNAAAKLRASLTGKFRTTYWFYEPKHPEIVDQANKLLSSQDLMTFFASLPVSKPKAAEVEQIDITCWEEKEKEHRLRIQEIQDMHEREMAAMRKQYSEETKEHEKRMQALEQEYKEVCQNLGEVKQRMQVSEKEQSGLEARNRKMEWDYEYSQKDTKRLSSELRKLLELRLQAQNK